MADARLWTFPAWLSGKLPTRRNPAAARRPRAHLARIAAYRSQPQRTGHMLGPTPSVWWFRGSLRSHLNHRAVLNRPGTHQCVRKLRGGSFLNMGKARNVRDLLRRQDKGGGMPWVNTTAADRNGNVMYADHSVVPHVTNGMKVRCLTPVGILLDTVAGLPGLDGTRARSSPTASRRTRSRRTPTTRPGCSRRASGCGSRGPTLRSARTWSARSSWSDRCSSARDGGPG